MAYGDGGFFFTQPVGNGYSGLGAFGASGATAPKLASTTSGIGSAIDSYCLKADAVCTAEELQAEMARIVGIWSSRGMSASQRRTSPWWPTFTALRQKLIQMQRGSRSLPQMRTPKMGFNVTTTPTATDDSSSSTTSESELGLEYYAQQSGGGSYAPMDVTVPELPEEAFMVGGEVEEPTGIMGWISQNLLISGLIAAGVGFGFWEARKRGMI